MYFGIEAKKFIDEYFSINDDRLMERMDEVIGENEDAVEISALADWVFRNYLAEAFAEALEKNNQQIYKDIKNMLLPIYEKLGISWEAAEEAYQKLYEMENISTPDPETAQEAQETLEQTPPEDLYKTNAFDEEDESEVVVTYYNSSFDPNRQNFRPSHPPPTLKPFAPSISEKLIERGYISADTADMDEDSSETTVKIPTFGFNIGIDESEPEAQAYRSETNASSDEPKFPFADNADEQTEKS